MTSFQVAMTLGVSRTVASFLLRDLPLHKEMPHDDDVMYEVTKTTWVEMEGKDGTKQTGKCELRAREIANLIIL